MDQMGALEVIFPETKAMKGCAQNSFHHKDVWGHSLAVLENCEYILAHLDRFFGPAENRIRENLALNSRLPLLKLASLLHDMAKPATRAVDEDSGRITFCSHDRKGGEMILETAARLKLPKRDRDFLETMLAQHLHVLNLSRPDVNPSTRLRWFRKLKDDAVPGIILGMADIKGTLGPESSEDERNRHLQWSREAVSEYYGRIKRDLERQDLIGGKDLMEIGIPPGPNMGRILKKVREAQDEGSVKDTAEALALARDLFQRHA